MKLINVTATLSHYVSYWPPSILSICCAQIHFIFSFRKTFYSNSSPGSPLNLNHMPSLGHETNCFTSATLLKAIQSLLNPDMPLEIVYLDCSSTYTVPYLVGSYWAPTTCQGPLDTRGTEG